MAFIQDPKVLLQATRSYYNSKVLLLFYASATILHEISTQISCIAEDELTALRAESEELRKAHSDLRVEHDRAEVELALFHHHLEKGRRGGAVVEPIGAYR